MAISPPSFPGSFILQVHPENEVMPIYKKLNEEFEKNVCYARESYEFFNQGSTPKEIQFEKDYNVGKHPLPFNHFFTFNYMSIVQESLKPAMSGEAVGYMRAIHYIEKHVLSKDLATFTPSQMLNLIDNIHQCLDPSFKKGFRQKDSVIFNPTIFPVTRNAETFKQVDQYARKHFTQEEFTTWKTTMRRKIWNQSFSTPPKLEPLLPEERKIFSKLATICPPYQLVPDLMTHVAEGICEKLQDKSLDVFDIMASAHQGVVTVVHPYDDGNGRLGRLLMAVIYKYKKKDARPLVIDSSANYTKASLDPDYKQFANYLRELEAKQIKNHQFIEDCFRSLYEASLETYKIEEKE